MLQRVVLAGLAAAAMVAAFAFPVAATGCG